MKAKRIVFAENETTINSKGKILTSSDEVLFDSEDFKTLLNRIDEVNDSLVKEWNSSLSYLPNQIVKYDGKNYVSLTQSTNKIPSDLNGYWAEEAYISDVINKPADCFHVEDSDLSSGYIDMISHSGSSDYLIRIYTATKTIEFYRKTANTSNWVRFWIGTLS